MSRSRRPGSQQKLGSKMLGYRSSAPIDNKKPHRHLCFISTSFARSIASILSHCRAGADGNVAEVVIKGGATLPADLVVVGSGIIPAVDFLKGAAAAGHITLVSAHGRDS